MHHHNATRRPAATYAPEAHGCQANAKGHDADEDDVEPLDREEPHDLLDSRAHVILAVAAPVAYFAHRLRAVAVRARVDQLAEVDDAYGRRDTLPLDIRRPCRFAHVGRAPTAWGAERVAAQRVCRALLL